MKDTRNAIDHRFTYPHEIRDDHQEALDVYDAVEWGNFCGACWRQTWENTPGEPVCECPVYVDCERGHGRVEIVEQESSRGFTGATIYFTHLACGCTLLDDSADSLESAR